METYYGLYRILVGISAAALLLGLILLARGLTQQINVRKHLYILGVVNVLSMLMFLFNVSYGYGSIWKEAILFVETTILVLNLIMGYFVLTSIRKPQSAFSEQIKHLFIFTFLLVCVYIVIYYVSNGSKSLLNKENSAFFVIYFLSIAVFLFGSFFPTLVAGMSLMETGAKKFRSVHILLVINGLNNTIGLVFYIGELPNREVSFVLNSIMNLVFAYYMAYYFLAVFFEKPAKKVTGPEVRETANFSWDQLKLHLQYWEEVRDYVSRYHPQLVQEIDLLELTDLEKTHHTLKQLNIKAKDIAAAMHVSVKAIEMNRYRIKQKLAKD